MNDDIDIVPDTQDKANISDPEVRFFNTLQMPANEFSDNVSFFRVSELSTFCQVNSELFEHFGLTLFKISVFYAKANQIIELFWVSVIHRLVLKNLLQSKPKHFLKSPTQPQAFKSLLFSLYHQE